MPQRKSCGVMALATVSSSKLTKAPIAANRYDVKLVKTRRSEIMGEASSDEWEGFIARFGGGASALTNHPAFQQGWIIFDIIYRPLARSPYPSPLPKEREQEVLAPLSLGRRVGEGLPHCVRRAIQIHAGGLMLIVSLSAPDEPQFSQQSSRSTSGFWAGENALSGAKKKRE